MAELKAMGKALQYLQKQHKDDFAFRANEPFVKVFNPYVSSSPSLNDALGIGGLPPGRTIQLAGVESSGKTLLSLDFIRNVQQQDPQAWAIFVDAEFTFDSKWAAKLGLDLDRLLVIPQNDAREIWTALVGDRGSKNKTPQPGLLTLTQEDESYKGLKLIVLDSIASMIPPGEMDSTPGSHHMGTMARFLSIELKKLTPLLAHTGVDFIAINQAREKIGQLYGDPLTTPGGRAFKHACSVMIHLAKMGGKDNAIFDDSGEQIGHRVKARIDKNKVAPAFKTAEFNIKYVEGLVDTTDEWVELGIKYEAIEQAGPQYKYAGQNIKGKKALSDYIKQNNLSNQLLADINKKKEDYKESPLESLSLEQLLSKAEELDVEIPKRDREDKEAILAHIKSLSKDQSDEDPNFR